MHRSGTSLATSWLARCGVHAGEGIEVAVTGNPRGQYEDADFVAFHDDLLRRNGWRSSLVDDDTPLVLGAEDRERAAKLVAQRADRAPWGWKDPRATLLLEWWKERIPQLKVVGVYRPSEEVVDSLLRRRRIREDRKRPQGSRLDALRWRWRRARVGVRRSWWNLPLVRRYAGVWCRYNRDLLDFARRHPDDAVVLRIDRLRDHSPELVEALNARWGFDLRPVSMDEVFDPGLLRPVGAVRARLVRTLRPEVARVEARLRQVEIGTLDRIGLEPGAIGLEASLG
jgi:hypothetical protein